ncbi:hypothetical protein ACHAPE_004038 [Trichoderma viride]
MPGTDNNGPPMDAPPLPAHLGREAVAKYIVSEDYIDKLIPLVEIAEDLESLPDLHRLCNIMKTILLLNDTAIIEHSVSDECLLGVVGALESDPGPKHQPLRRPLRAGFPDFPSHKANHRHWLSNQGRFKEVVPRYIPGLWHLAARIIELR